jgi:hypothetical protein
MYSSDGLSSRGRWDKGRTHRASVEGGGIICERAWPFIPFEGWVLIGSEAYLLHRFTPDLQELEVVMGDEHISFTSTKIGSLVDVEKLR